MSSLNISMGTAGFPGPDNLQPALDVLKQYGVKEIDSAEMYGTNETDLGAVKAADQGFIIATKNPGGWFPDSLTPPENLKSKTDASLAKLGVQQVDILYIHGPDPSLKPADYAHTFDEMYKAGKFRRFGISNFTPEQTRELHAYSKENGLVLPTVYQGNYNAVSRVIDTTLFPVLRELGIPFYAYSPIAGGFLTKSRKALEEGTEGGRFAVGDNGLNKMYRGFYLKPTMLEGLGKWEELAKTEGVSQAELAYRWIYYHSALKPKEHGDFVIVGASKVGQISQTLEGLKRGPLKPEVVKGIDEVWSIVKDVAIVDNYEAVGGKPPMKPEDLGKSLKQD